MEKVNPGPVAVIDIGSNEIRLRIAQGKGDKIKFLESIAYPLNLGRDTFNMGMISFDKVHTACEIIENFLVVCQEYGACKIKAVATTAIREASNLDYILDQIRIKTGLEIDVIDENLEKLYIFKLIHTLLDAQYKASALIAYTGSGSIGVSMMAEEKMTFIRHIKIGSLRVSELFDEAHEYSNEFYILVEEYLYTFMSFLENVIDRKAKYFIASGVELATIAGLCGARKDQLYYHIDRYSFLELYEKIKFKSIDRIVKDYDLPEEQAELLLPAMCIYKNLLLLTEADTIICPLVYLTEAIAFELLFENRFNNIDKDFYNYTLLSARRLAKKYDIMQAHYELVEDFSVRIFDKMKKIHGMGRKEKMLLQTAAILHDCGKFINIRSHYQLSHMIISASDIVGLSKEDLDIVANIAYYHSRLAPRKEDENYGHLRPSKRTMISKLSAILRVADALDRSQKQKFKDINVKISDNNELLINITTGKNIDLEQWALETKGLFFEEVFGLKPVIRKRTPR